MLAIETSLGFIALVLVMLIVPSMLDPLPKNEQCEGNPELSNDL